MGLSELIELPIIPKPGKRSKKHTSPTIYITAPFAQQPQPQAQAAIAPQQLAVPRVCQNDAKVIELKTELKRAQNDMETAERENHRLQEELKQTTRSKQAADEKTTTELEKAKTQIHGQNVALNKWDSMYENVNKKLTAATTQIEQKTKECETNLQLAESEKTQLQEKIKETRICQEALAGARTQIENEKKSNEQLMQSKGEEIKQYQQNLDAKAKIDQQQREKLEKKQQEASDCKNELLDAQNQLKAANVKTKDCEEKLANTLQKQDVYIDHTNIAKNTAQLEAKAQLATKDKETQQYRNALANEAKKYETANAKTKDCEEKLAAITQQHTVEGINAVLDQKQLETLKGETKTCREALARTEAALNAIKQEATEYTERCSKQLAAAQEIALQHKTNAENALQSNAALATKANDYNSAIQSLQNEHDQKITSLNAEFAKERIRVKAEVDAALQALQITNSQLNKEKEKQYQTALDKVTGQMTALKEQYENAISAERVNTMEADSDAKSARLATEKLSEEMKKQISTITSIYDEELTQAKTKMSKCADDLQRARDQINEDEKERSIIQNELDFIRADARMYDNLIVPVQTLATLAEENTETKEILGHTIAFHRVYYLTKIEYLLKQFIPPPESQNIKKSLDEIKTELEDVNKFHIDFFSEQSVIMKNMFYIKQSNFRSSTVADLLNVMLELQNLHKIVIVLAQLKTSDVHVTKRRRDVESKNVSTLVSPYAHPSPMHVSRIPLPEAEEKQPLSPRVELLRPKQKQKLLSASKKIIRPRITRPKK
jgi:chromosome segregation ATPase